MSVLDRLRRALTRDPGPVGASPASSPSESDVGHDPRTAGARVEGGEHDDLAGDRGSTSGTGKTGGFVGQVAGDDLGYAGETGAEARRRDEP